MKLWHFAALVAVLGIAYVLIKRPSATTVGTTPASSNAQLTSIFSSALNAGVSFFGGNKAAPPSTVPADTSIGMSTDTGKAATQGVDVNNAATYVPGESIDTYTGSIFGPGTEG
jgi:hypothetical protein